MSKTEKNSKRKERAAGVQICNAKILEKGLYDIPSYNQLYI